ncbi:MAG: hypothetical protein MAG581_01533 [Deltaproteobacteria bacterium]|jgi:predicted nucleic acid-binding protein|nr:hypothetical protein [Deltaproteobacteria bacterium]
MIVVDTNVITYLLISGEHSQQAEKLLRHDPHWIAPFLWRSEFRNVLSLYMRKGFISLELAMRLSEHAEQLMSNNEFDISSSDVLKFVQYSECSAYDCEFVALATQFKVLLYTMDEKILRAFPNTAQPLTAIY